VTGGHDGLPPTGQRGQQRQPGPAAGVQGQVDVLKRPLQRELGQVIMPGMRVGINFVALLSF
jgi:hypothetical protein